MTPPFSKLQRQGRQVNSQIPLSLLEPSIPSARYIASRRASVLACSQADPTGTQTHTHIHAYPPTHPPKPPPPPTHAHLLQRLQRPLLGQPVHGAVLRKLDGHQLAAVNAREHAAARAWSCVIDGFIQINLSISRCAMTHGGALQSQGASWPWHMPGGTLRREA